MSTSRPIELTRSRPTIKLKRTRSRRTPLRVKSAETVNGEQTIDARALIEQAAYYRAAARGFAPGHELDDWLAAEAQVLEQLRQVGITREGRTS